MQTLQDLADVNKMGTYMVQQLVVLVIHYTQVWSGGQHWWSILQRELEVKL